MSRLVAVFVLICCSLSLPADSIAAAAACTRADLQGAVDRYLDALKNGRPSLMALAPQAKYIENRKEMPFGEGVWKEAVAVDLHRSLLDVDICESFTEIISATGAHPYVIGTRLKVAGSRISEVEALVTDSDDWFFNASNYLKYSSQEKWDILPPEKRSDRAALIKAANAYFDVFKDFSTASNVPWGIPCARLEGGMYTNPNGDPNATCTGGPPLEGSVQIVNRRFIVDEDMGTVVGLVDFGGKDGWPDSHTFRLEGGKVRYVHTLTVCPNGCELPAKKD
jgi:hypothetical protein